MEQSSFTQTEVKHDQYKNIWLHFPTEKKQQSIISGPVESRAVITPTGRNYLKRNQRSDIFERINESSLHRRKKIGEGDEGVVNHVTDATNIFNQMIGRFEKDAAVKKLHDSDLEYLLPWETVQIYDYIRPLFQNANLQLINPYGATNEELFMPYIKGKSLRRVLENLSNYGLSFEDALKTDKTIQQKTLDLHHNVNTALFEYLTDRGLQRVKEGEMIDQNEQDVYFNPMTNKEVRVLVDFHPGSIEDVSDYRYRQWLLPESIEDQIKRMPTASYTTDLIQQNAICVDPIYIHTRPPGWRHPLLRI